MKSAIRIKPFSQREVILLLGGWTALAFLILIFRIRVEGNFRYTFLIWNLFLAYVPVAGVLMYQKLRKTRLLKLGLLSFWLLFFPNAPYIITDYIHLRHYFTFLDFSMVSLYALLGLIAGFYSLSVLQKDISLLNKRWGIPVLFFLTSIGVYLGRFIRWNSWDILEHPMGIVQDVLEPFFFPMQNLFALEFIGAFTLFLILAYAGFKRILKLTYAEEV